MVALKDLSSLGVTNKSVSLKQNTRTIPEEEYSDISTLESVFAGIASGLNRNTKRFIFIRCKHI
jgi:hypothetical protein